DTMTERAFQQEILAQFLEDGGGVFRGVRAAATSERLESGLQGLRNVCEPWAPSSACVEWLWSIRKIFISQLLMISKTAAVNFFL
ncbi:MAG: hypothetical protein MUO62_15755, partial [Anaerolineales bacterium]|nr:hypothetical protein [Anaerolineales bacterium]